MNQWREKSWVFILCGLLAGCPGQKTGKNPSNRVPASSFKLVQYASCDSLEADLKAHFLDRANSVLERSYDYSPIENLPMAGGVATAASEGKAAGEDYSGTNNQEAGVGEADTSQFDGNYLYVLNGAYLEIVDAQEPHVLQTVGRLKLPEGTQEILLGQGDKLYGFSQSWSQTPDDGKLGFAPPGYLQSIVSVMDVSDKAHPKFANTIRLDASYQTARALPDGRILFVSTSSPDFQDLKTWSENGGNIETVKAANNAAMAKKTLTDFLPKLMLDGKAVSLSEQGCSGVYAVPENFATQFVHLSSISFDEDGEAQVDTRSILGNTPQVYVNEEAVVLADDVQPDYWRFDTGVAMQDKSNVHLFGLVKNDLSYEGSGQVDGDVRDQFSLSYHDGYVRVFSTKNQNLARPIPIAEAASSEDEIPKVENLLSVLDVNNGMKLVGRVDGIAKGEVVQSARFYAAHAYLVTFERTDPLFTIDLSDPTNPQIAGELKVPGFSGYLQEIDEGKALLGVGYAGDDDGLTGEVQVSLFDVSNFQAPQLASSYVFNAQVPAGMTCSVPSSQAANNHKAIAYFAPQKALAISVAQDCWSLNRQSHSSQVAVLHVAAGEEIAPRGYADQEEIYGETCSMPYYASADISRVYFNGEAIYAISPVAVTSHDLSADGNALPKTSHALLQGACLSSAGIGDHQ